MNINTETLPKQAHALLDGPAKVSTYEATGGLVTSQFALHNLSLIPAIPSGSIIHDNMCGSGTATKAILSSHPSPSTLQIHATDTDPLFLSSLQAYTSTHNLPSVSISNEKAEALPFPDNHFTHSITNMGIFFTSSAGLDAAKEIHRTLQPAGTAVVNCWEHVTWFAPLKLVHDFTRPGTPYPAPPIGWSDGVQIQKVMREAGFAAEDMRVERSEAWARTKDLRGWAEMAWAYLGGIGTWRAEDEGCWDEAVDKLVEVLKSGAEENVKVVDGETWMRASQWVVVAKK